MHYLPLITLTPHHLLSLIQKCSILSLICATCVTEEPKLLHTIADMADLFWFYIAPKDTDAIAIVNDTRNQGYVVTINEAEEAIRKVIPVVFKDSLEPHCILSFGRDLDNDIQCDPPGFRMARRQCSFLFHNRSLIFRDHSGTRNSKISPVHVEDSKKWNMDRVPRQRAIPEYGDWKITMGQANFLLRFRRGMHKLDPLIIFSRANAQ